MSFLKSLWSPWPLVAVVGEEKSQTALVRPKLDVVASRRERGTARSDEVRLGFEGNIRSVFDIVISDWKDMA